MSIERITRALLLCALLGVLALFWRTWCEFPFHWWNDVRLAPAFAFRAGVNPYPVLGEGPLFTWIYGPIGIFINLPATLATTPLGALHVASIINALVIIGPLALIFFRSADLRSRSVESILGLATAIMLVPLPSLMFQVADNCAIALGLLSCWCIARTAKPSGRSLALGALLAALAIWSKQTALYLVPAQIGFLCLNHQRAAAFYLGMVLGFWTIGLAWFSLLFGFSNLWLNLVAIPARVPLAPEGWLRIVASYRLELGVQLLLLILTLFVLRREQTRPTRSSECTRLLRVTFLVALAALPIGVAGLLRHGGLPNSIHCWGYLLPVLLVWLASSPRSHFAFFRVCGPLAIAFAVKAGDLVRLPTSVFTAQFDAAKIVMADHPHTLWFPNHPLITYYADKRLWHTEDGILTRYLAGHPISPEALNNHLPASIDGVAYGIVGEPPVSLPLLPKFTAEVRYPYWILHTRANDQTASATSAGVDHAARD